MPSREYSDSEEDAPTPTSTVRLNPGVSSAQGSPKAPTSSGPRVKLTFRPNVNHLINDDSSHSQPHSERSSLSPPPPLTLKIGPRPQPAGPSRMVNRIDYSDSSDEEDSSRPNKKSKVTNRPSAVPAGSSLVEGSTAMRKSYDWLAPSAVGASHSGPPERLPEGVKEKKPGEEEMEVKKPKVKSEKPSGRGKNWRKGVTKGMLGAMKEAEALNQALQGSHTPGDATPSVQGSPEIVPHDTLPRAPSPPFVSADAATLGIPVFTKPIIAPKLHYTLWPKVSPAFSPINGGDVGPFPRKERVRAWKHSQKTLVGIGGGSLRFNTWTRGPPSQLSLLVKADKEAKDLLAKKNKAAGTGSATPSERPQLHTSLSTDSIPTLPQPPIEVADDMTSEAGDADDTVSLLSNKEGTIVPQPISAVPAKRKAPKAPKPKVGPRKSKLAQEIHPVPDSATSAIEDIM